MIATEPLHLANGHQPSQLPANFLVAPFNELRVWTDGRSTGNIAESFAIDLRVIEGFLTGIATVLEQSVEEQRMATLTRRVYYHG